MNNNPHILGLDISSTNLGFCLYAGRVLASGEQKLTGAIEARCAQAYNALWQLLHDWPAVDVLAIEAPVARFASAVIPQCRVSGAILTLAGQRGIPVVEVSPAAAKFALTGRGGASKDTMMSRARAYGVVGEHAADALGVALASLRRVEVVESEPAL